MIIKLFIVVDNKLILNNFTINNINNKIIIKSVENLNNVIKIPIYNKINGIDYYPIIFPLEMPIYDKNIFNPYIILSSYNINFSNDIDFFNQLNSIIETNFGLCFYNFDYLLNNPDLFSKIINENYIKLINFEILKDINNFEEFVRNLWLCIHINKLFTIFILIKYPTITNKNMKEISNKINFTKKMLVIPNHMKSFKYVITSTPSDFGMNFLEYYSYDFKVPLKISDIKLGVEYYIVINKSESETTITSQETSYNQSPNQNKIIKISVSKINKNIINIDLVKNILFENYKWYYYYPNLMIDNNYIIYQTYVNNTFTKELIKNCISLEDTHIDKILDYYNTDNKASNLISLNMIYENIGEYLTDMNILKINSFSQGFFDYITIKYSNTQDNKMYDILGILFNNYSYPIKHNKHDFEPIFDYILYFSLYNHKSIWNHKNFSDIGSLHPTINSLVPGKLKNLYTNLIKFMYQTINDKYDIITYNQKFYSDYLYRNIIKILLFGNSSYSNLSTNLFKNILKPSSYDKLRLIIHTNLLLIDISNKLSWSNLPKKLNYLNVYYKNDSIIYYQDKLNKSIIPDNFDLRIKKIIENPFEMYKYLRKEKDFVKWTNFITNHINQLYIVPISLSTDDFNHIGKLIFLLFNIREQNIKDDTYIKFVNFCNLHDKLVLESNRINLKIREYFPTLKCTINLGFLAKHLTWDKETMTFDEISNDKSPDILSLELKLKIATNKYYKYKAKYLESRDINIDSIIKHGNNFMIVKNKPSISETSNVNSI
jgi:hypothetical protein